MEKQIIIIKPKSLSSKDKAKLTKAGNVVIEHPASHEIKFQPHPQSDSYEFVNCAECGERIYLLSERLKALKSGKKYFFCSQGHAQRYS